MATQHYRTELDGLRALAVLAVVLYHARLPGFGGGYVGVDVFFVISGYLITRGILHKTERGTFRFGAFYLRRFRRLFPAVAATALLTLLAGVLFLTPDALSELAVSAVAAIASVANIFFWSEAGYFADASWTKPLLHTWSLSVEEQFYLIWPALLVGAAALLRGRRKAGDAPAAKGPEQGVALWVVVTGVGLLSFAACEWWLGRNPDSAFFLTPFRVYEFAIGALCVRFHDRTAVQAPALRTLLFWLGVAMVVFSIAVFTHDTRFPGRAALVPCIGTALVICGRPGRAGLAAFANPASRWIGVKSYSIYLVHWPIVTYWLYTHGGEMTIVAGLGIVVASLVLGSLLHDLIEAPFRDGRPAGAMIPYPRAKTGATIALPAVATALAATIYLQDGWTWRLGAGAQAYVGYELDNAVACQGTFCTLGDASDPQPPMILVGDSDMQQYFEAMDAYYTQLGRKGVMLQNRACAAFTDDVHAGETSTSGCPDVRRRFAELTQSYPASPVLIAALWQNFSRMRTPDGEPFSFDLEDPDELVRYGDYIVRELDEFLSRLGERRVVLMGEIPVAKSEADLSGCLLRPTLFGGSGDEDADGTRLQDCYRQAPDAYGLYLNARLEELAGRYRNVVFTDPYDALCDETGCLVSDEDRLYYRDKNHLNIPGAVYVVNALSRDLSTMARRTGEVRATDDNTVSLQGFEAWTVLAKAQNLTKAEAVEEAERLAEAARLADAERLAETGGEADGRPADEVVPETSPEPLFDPFAPVRIAFPADGRIALRYTPDQPMPAPLQLRVRMTLDVETVGDAAPDDREFMVLLANGCANPPVEARSVDVPLDGPGTVAIDEEAVFFEPLECAAAYVWPRKLSMTAAVSDIDVSIAPY